MHSTFFPEGLILLAVFLALPIVLWRVSARSEGWLRLGLRIAALLIVALLAWNTVIIAVF